MKTNKITKWAALLLTFSGMAAMSASAATKVVNGVAAPPESNQTYEAVSGTAALLVYNPGASYSGTNITLGTTFDTSNGRFGAHVDNQAALALVGSSITTSGSTGYGIYLAGTSSAILNQINISTSGYAAHGIYVINSSTLTMTGGTVTTSNTSSVGIRLVKSSTATLNNVTVKTDGYSSQAVRLDDSSLTLSGGTLSTSGYQGHGVSLVGASSVNLEDVTIATAGDAGVGVYISGSGDATAKLNNVQITTTGTDMAAYGIRVGNEGDKSLEIRDSSVTAKGPNTAAIIISPQTSEANQARVVIDNSTITSEYGYAITFGNDTDRVKNWASMPDFANTFGTYDVTISNGSVIDGGDAHDAIHINSIYTGTLSGGDGTVHTGTVNLLVNLHIDNSEIADDLNISTSATANIDFKNGAVLNGDLKANDYVEVSVSLDNSAINGDITGSGSSTLNVSGKDSTVTGNVNSNDDANVSVNLDNGKLTGDINSSGSSTINITGSNGSTVTGTATSKDDSNININISGPGSSWFGDINQQDDSKIIINIENGATGTGGFNGGDLNVLGPDSRWDFDKDSHVNNGYNDGTLNINNKDVTFDNLTNNGKIIIDVNSDDQSHGKLDVTGTANGDGKINVNVTGSTAVSNSDRDKILNDMLDHNAKDAWKFDPIEWGLEEDDVITNPDGSVYVRPNGKLSTAGSIATGLIAAQKSSWFAQQNSLLKRMGELRLQNSVESVTISGKEDKDVAAPMLSADKLIENVWIRSYGQQLNYGASVTGQSFKQYVYGVDIGTDHKWQLDADNQLFAGVFLGYGAADTDHRHHGSKSEISNYYAGLYASWLNVDGWYLDATLKAQYTDNELNGNTGANYFNGSYNNWSVGGSLEFGKQIKFKDDWFVEPQLQANYLHILASDYTMSQGLNVNVSDLDAFQLRFGIVAGKTLKLKNGGALQPYFKISGVEMVSTGGKISAMGNTVRPNLDGARAELGAGIIWQLDANNQLHLDYEASFGDKYDKPWGLTAGYRYQF